MALPASAPGCRLGRCVAGRAVRRLAEHLCEFDREVGMHGPGAGIRWMLPQLAVAHGSSGAEQVPRTGPLIIAANHPGAFDAAVILAHVPRADYKIVIGDIPPYRSLPHVSRHVIFSPGSGNPSGRTHTVRHAVRHLSDGGALLIFPRGGIEPDPAVMDGADVDFGRWSRSLETFLKRVPRAQVVVTMVSGVVAERSLRHPVTWLCRRAADRQRLATLYQSLRQVYAGRELYGLTPHVTFGEALAEIAPECIRSEVERAARQVLAQHLTIIRRHDPVLRTQLDHQHTAPPVGSY